MTDDPRELLRAAGVECAEVDEYAAEASTHGEEWRGIHLHLSDAAILALARLVAKYKYQRDQVIDEIATIPYENAGWRADLERRWEER